MRIYTPKKNNINKLTIKTAYIKYTELHAYSQNSLIHSILCTHYTFNFWVYIFILSSLPLQFTLYIIN